MKTEFKINDLVISSNLGVGEIVGFEKLGITGEEFLVIQSEERRVRTLLPMRESHQIRKLATSIQIKNSLKKLGIKPKKLNFDCKKERIHYFKERSSQQDIKSVVDTICELSALDDRGTLENKLLQGLKNSLALEIELVMKVDAKQAKKMVQDSIAIDIQ